MAVVWLPGDGGLRSKRCFCVRRALTARRRGDQTASLDAELGESGRYRCSRRRFCVQRTRRRGAETRYRTPGRVIEGDAESVFRPVGGGSGASGCGFGGLGETVVHSQKNG